MIPFVVLGFAFAIYLTVLHVKVFTQADFQADSSVCSIGEKANCETVAENPYSVFLFMPVSVWGILGYLFIGAGVIAGLLARSRRLPLVYLLAFVGFACCTALLLGYISITKISSICIFCFGTYFLNFSLMGLVLYGLWRDRINPFKGAVELFMWFIKHPLHLGGLGATGVGLLLAGFLWYPRYWVPATAPATDLSMPTGMTEDGHPWIGSESPLVVIAEYSDFECPACARYHGQVRELVARNADTVRLVHYNYPLDKACNPMLTEPYHLAACERAKLGLCAARQGKFWQANDLMYANRNTRFSAYRLSLSLELDEAAMKTCVADPKIAEHVKADVARGNELKLDETPAFFVDGVRMQGLGQIEKLIAERTKLESGVDGQDRPWIGAAKPDVTVHEYSDYQCPFCSREHRKVRRIVAQNPTRVRLVHHHFPLDQACNRLVTKPFHVRACVLAKMATCALKQNAFWGANDLLFQKANHGMTEKDLAARLKLDEAGLTSCVKDAVTAENLRIEIEEGLLLKLDSTPVFMIDGKEVPIQRLKHEIETRLAA
ncbi:thioredoxin domain-containing protein, partial [Myxococcota bacterium]|nr:thioredoxin domain-containing protein [Myxococcota bacterium]MBU1511342.1 thioredoxin domain-containing protein [Myxococcota bacterium]